MASNTTGIAVAATALVAGILCRRYGRGKPINYLSKFLLFIAIPYLILYGTLFTNLAKVSAMIFVATSYTLVASVACFLLYFKVLRYEREVAGSLIYSSALLNAGFLPIPLVTMLYGDPSPAAIYNAAYNIVASITVPVVGTLLKAEGGKPKIVEVLKGVITFPPATALITALTLKAFLGSYEVPAVLISVKDVLGIVVLSSFAIVGYNVFGIGKAMLKRLLLWVFAWRLLISPLIHALLSAIAGLSGVWLATALIESLMPPATMNLVYAEVYGFRVDIIAVSIAIITPISLAASVALRMVMPPL